ncbi:lasso peptide isopeptide bond-forming cyclase [Myceligenerans cantabricum]
MVWLAGASTSIQGPYDARLLWGGPRPVWAVDEPQRSAVTARTVEDGTYRLGVVGDVWLTGDEMAHGLALVRQGDWRALTRWAGSYWVVADNGTRTIVLTDLCGQRPVYYAQLGKAAVWATQAKPLAALVGAPVDHSAILRRLVTPTLGDLVGAETTFTGVTRVPGGHALTVTAGSSRIDRYEPETQDATFPEATTMLRDALTTAVDIRAASSFGPLTADFSGGLDSTTVALLAAQAGQDVLGVTLADRLSPNDDVPYAVLAATAEPRITHHVVSPDPTPAFFDDLLDAPATDQPHSDAARWARKWSYQRHATAAGSTLHLTGSGGDLLLAAPATCLADLAARGSHLALWRAAIARARLRHHPVYRVMQTAHRLSRQSYSAALQELSQTIRSAERSSLPRRQPAWFTPTGVAAWLTRDARHDLSAAIADLAEQSRDAVEPLSGRRAWGEVREFGTYQAELNAQAGSLGLRLQAPFLDNEVVRACMALPVHLHNDPHRQKPLLAAALRGLAPDVVLDRRTKGVYGAAGYIGVARNIDAIRSLVETSELVATGLLDGTALAHDLTLAAAGIPTRFAALESVVTTELWLSQHRPDARTPRWEMAAHAY